MKSKAELEHLISMIEAHLADRNTLGVWKCYSGLGVDGMLLLYRSPVYKSFVQFSSQLTAQEHQEAQWFFKLLRMPKPSSYGHVWLDKLKQTSEYLQHQEAVLEAVKNNDPVTFGKELLFLTKNWDYHAAFEQTHPGVLQEYASSVIEDETGIKLLATSVHI